MTRDETQVLRDALLEAAQEEYVQAVEESAPPTAFSPAYRRWEAALLSGRKTRRIGRWAACWLLVAVLSLSAVLACSPTVRAMAAESLGLAPQADLPSINVTVRLGGVNGGDYRSATFACTAGNGRGIRYWYRNDSTAPSTVYLLRERVIGAPKVVDSIVVPPGEEGAGTYAEAEGRVFHIRITQLEGGDVVGALRGAQIEGSSKEEKL